MEKLLIVISVILLSAKLCYSQDQDQHKITPIEQRMTDSLCGCVSKIDISKIATKEDAVAAYTNCVGQHVDILTSLTEERHIEFTNIDAMRGLGMDLAKNLMRQNCPSFMKLSMLMSKENDKGQSISESHSTTGSFKRMDSKGFNYLVINDLNNSEKSFLWLRQFPGSEKFMNGVIAMAGKRIKVTWHELEVYLPQAKGYYNVKEITGIDFL
jgi:hypothetical protein